MKSLIKCLLLVLASSAFAQPWQWEAYPGDYYNPTGFASGFSCIGDFNGDGRDEPLRSGDGQFTVWLQDTGALHWTAHSGTTGPVSGNGLEPIDLDGDGADEVIEFGHPYHAWKAVSFNPWTWEQRDDLLASLHIEGLPDSLDKITFGDYDGDGLMNAAYLYSSGLYIVPFLHMLELNASGIWELTFVDSSISSMLRFGYFDGDFDHDGDTDLGFEDIIFDPTDSYQSRFIENLGNGNLQTHWWSSDLIQPSGGDLDNDGQWEGVYFPPDYPGNCLVEVEPDSAHFLHFVSQTYLGGLPGPAFGNFRVNGETVVGAIRNYGIWQGPTLEQGFYCMTRTDTGWQDSPIGFHISPLLQCQCLGGSRADMDGDGLGDLITLLYDQTGAWSSYWSIWKNHGTANQDSFSSPTLDTDPTLIYFSHHFPDPDADYSMPQIGDITGDGRAELAFIPRGSHFQDPISFYEMIGEIEDTTFVLRPEWSDGLPVGWSIMRLADLDGDGLSDVIGVVTGEQAWRTFFRRNGMWVEYFDIMPPVGIQSISFADADNDGDVDLFTPNQLWYNLSPTTAHDPEFSPASFRIGTYPNPFNPTTTISFSLPKAEAVELKVFDVTGRLVSTLAKGMLSAGDHTVHFDAGDLPSGIYFAQITSATHSMTHKLMLLK